MKNPNVTNNDFLKNIHHIQMGLDMERYQNLAPWRMVETEVLPEAVVTEEEAMEAPIFTPMSIRFMQQFNESNHPFHLLGEVVGEELARAAPKDLTLLID